jgi:hypothetical protein
MSPFPRLHLFELIDQDWYPRAPRDLGTDYLETISTQGLLASLLVPLLVLLFTPLVRPLTPLRLLLTYVIPVAPLTITWDGLVSALRAHRPEELRALTDSLAREGYTWEVGQLTRPGKGTVTYVLGLPTARARLTPSE